ncbi:MAG TPA: SDR family oxidoreductase [Solirubrobacteraceae bacterium]|nr:SDR family oxidoreductase [Solirubrobacteraceae bacterium]
MGRVCMVTGATSGLGLATARQLVARGATVVIAGRSAAKCADVAAALRAGAPPGGSVDGLVADLADQRAVRRLAAEVERRHPRLDVLVNNAGATFPHRRITPEGVEMTLAVNHLAPFLLTTLLLDRLRAGAPSRIVNVASVAHQNARLDFDDLALDHGYRPFAAYGRSKLANLLFTYELARRLEGTGVTANAVHPGLVRTALGDHSGALRRVGWHLLHVAYRKSSLSADEGADAITFLASSPEVEGVTGRYFVDRKPVPSSPASRDAVAAARLWTLSEQLVAPSADGA